MPKTSEIDTIEISVIPAGELGTRKPSKVLKTNIGSLEKDFKGSDAERVLKEGFAISINSTKHQAHIESITIGKFTSKSNGCTLKLTWADQIPPGVPSGIEKYTLPKQIGLLQLRDDDGESIALSLDSMSVVVDVATGTHTATCKPKHSFDVAANTFLLRNRLRSDEGNEVEVEFIPSQREMFGGDGEEDAE